MAQREEVITRAIMVKLGHGVSLFDADDVLLAADVDETRLKEITERIVQAATEATKPPQHSKRKEQSWIKPNDP